MSDGIRVTLEGVDNTGKAFSSAISNVNKLDAATKKLGATSAASPTSVMDKWTKSQYAAAQAGSLLTDKAIALSNAINTGKMSTEQARKEYMSFEKQMKGNVWQAMTLGEKYGVVRQRIADISTEAIKFGGAAVGVGLVAKGVYDLGKSGAQLQYTEQRFDRLALSMGTTGDVFMDKLRVATRGTVSDMQLANNAANLFQLGLARTSEEAVRLSKVQTALGMDTGELTLALANQSKRRLDQLGLSLTKFNDIEAKLKDRGMSKEDAFREAFMLTAEDTIRTTGNMADSSLGNYQRMEAQAANVWDNLKKSFSGATSGTVGDIANVLQGMNAVQNQDMAWTGNLFQLLTQNGPALRQGTAQDFSNLWSGGGRQRVGNNPYAAIEGLSAVQNYTAMAYAYRKGGGGGAGTQQAEEAPVDYAAMTDGAIKLTAASRSYADSVSQITARFDDNKAVREMFKNDVKDLKDQLKDGEITNSQYYDSVQKLTAAWKDGSFAASRQNDAMRALDEQYNAQGAQFALNLMQQDEMFDPQKAYDFAAATGQITKQAAEQYKAYTKIKDALGDNSLNAEQAAYATRALSGDISALNGMKAQAWIDVYIRTHGSMIDLGTVGMTAEDFGNKRRVGGEIGFASGTPDIGMSGVFRVGEMGEEGLVVRRDGSVGVIPAGTWREMQKYGIGADGGFAMGTADAGGGGGMTAAGYRYVRSRKPVAYTSSAGAPQGQVEAETAQTFTKITSTLTQLQEKIDLTTASREMDLSMSTMIKFAGILDKTMSKHDR